MILYKQYASTMIVICILLNLFVSTKVNATKLGEADIKTSVKEWNANWIWDTSITSNNWMDFRKKVFLDQVPNSVIARIAVDSHYWLYINGELVVFERELKRGPTPDDTYYDNVDIKKYLKKGSNTIAVLVWFWGKSGASYSNNDSGKAGFLFQADFGGQSVVSDSSWKVLKNAAYLDDRVINPLNQPNYRLPEFNIYYDARNEVTEWYLTSFNDSNWENATELSKATSAPWNQLYERTIPLLKDYGLKEYENMNTYRNHITTALEKIEMVIPYNAQITPYLKVEAPAGLKISMKTDNYRDPTGNGNFVMSTYITKSGVQQFEALGWFNGQYVSYQIPAGV